MTVADDLRAARALIQTPEKWLQGCYVNRHKQRCAIGAVMEINATSPQSMRRALQAAMPPGRQAMAVGDYNDLPTTTHADILALFDRAIAAAESPSP